MNTSIRTIKSHVDKVSAYLFKEDRLQESEYAPILVHIDTIDTVIDYKNNTALLDSLMTAGLQTPIVIVNNTEENYTYITQNKNTEKRESNKPFLCYSGNQRLAAVKKLGYDTVHCIFVEDVHWAHAVHLVLNK